MAPACYVSPYEIPKKNQSPTPTGMRAPEQSKFDYANFYRPEGQLKKDIFKRALF